MNEVFSMWNRWLSILGIGLSFAVVLGCSAEGTSHDSLEAEADAATENAAIEGAAVGDAAIEDAAVEDGGTEQKAPSLDFSAFDQEIEAFLDDQGLEGASAAVVHQDYGVVYEAGYGNFDADRVYLIASSSKALSAGILMRLADQELLDIDAPISTYLSEWGEYKTDISTAQLLSNSSGLVALSDDPLYAPYLCQYIYTGTLQECATAIYTADDEADRIEPDTEFHYGGGQWQLAGGIAEVVSGKSWAELVDETYLQPCDTPSLGYTNQYSLAYESGGDVSSALDYPSFFQADIANLPETDNPSIEGGGYTTAVDYAKILLMHLREGTCGDRRVLSQESVARMQEDRILEAYQASTSRGHLAGYGLGWWIDRENPGVFVDGGAYGAVPWLDLSRKYGAIIILEANSSLGRELLDVAKPILDTVFDETDS